MLTASRATSDTSEPKKTSISTVTATESANETIEPADLTSVTQLTSPTITMGPATAASTSSTARTSTELTTTSTSIFESAMKTPEMSTTTSADPTRTTTLSTEHVTEKSTVSTTPSTLTKPETTTTSSTEPETTSPTTTLSSTSSSTTADDSTTPSTTYTPSTTTEPTTSSSTSTTSTTTTAPPTTTTPNALNNFTFVNVPGSTVQCFYETRSLRRFSTNGLCAMAGSDLCKARGLVSVFGHCVGKNALSVVPVSQCVSTLSYSATKLCVPWEAMFVDKANPTSNGGAISANISGACSTGLLINNKCAPNFLGVQMLTGRYTDNLLGFQVFNEEGLMISTCFSTYQTVRDDNIGWTQTGGQACSAGDFYMNMGVAPCGKHSMLIKGSGGERCIGWDAGSTTTPFNTSLTSVSNWFVWDGKDTRYGIVTGKALKYEEYMVLPRVLVTPVS